MTTEKRPEYVKCVQREHVEHKDKSWCGQVIDSGEWVFTGPGHAAENGLAQGRLIACSECIDAIQDALLHGYEE